MSGKEVSKTAVMRADSGLAPPVSPTATNTVINIESPAPQRSSAVNASRAIFGMSRPMFMVAAAGTFYMLFMSGSAAYFLSQFLRIPNLDSQIATLSSEIGRLEDQIEELNGEITRLQEVVDRLSGEVTRLEAANEEAQGLLNQVKAENDVLTGLNDELTSQNDFLIDQNEILNSTNAQLEESIVQLQEQNEEFSELIIQQNQSIAQLDEEVAQLENSTAQLNATVMALETEVLLLEEQNSALLETQETLNETIDELNVEIANLTNQNEQLQEIYNELNSVVEYLDDQFGTVNASFSATIASLNESLSINTAVAVTQLASTYQGFSSDWDCVFFESFPSEPWSIDPTVPIGVESYPDVIAWVNMKDFDPLCLNQTDVEVFMADAFDLPFPPVDISMQLMQSGVNSYNLEAMTYYFPTPENPDGLTSEEWADAFFNCSLLPDELKFQFM